jgi:sensor histidine kinase YesM
MFIQPSIENAIWHGILPLQKKGLLRLELKKYDGGILCVIEDNGIGLGSRKQEPKGAEITSRRIELLNSLYKTDFGITAITLTDETGKETGSKIVIKFPAIEA